MKFVQVFLVLLLAISLSVTAVAQEDVTPTPGPEIELGEMTPEPLPPTATLLPPTEIPPTEVPPTEPPEVTETVEPPTAEPPEVTATVEPPTAEPTEVTETVEPPEVTETVVPPTEPPEVTETVEPPPTEVNTAPVFDLAAGASYEVVPGVPLTLSFTVSDDSGMVRVIAEVDGVTLDVVHTEPASETAPFVTGISVTYTPAADFTGPAMIRMTAIDPLGERATTAVVITAAPPEATPEVTVEPTVEPTLLPVEPATEERILNYDPQASEESISAMLQALGAEELERIPEIGAMRVMIRPTAADMSGALSAMAVASPAAQAAGLTSVEPIIMYSLHRIPMPPNDPPYPDQWALQPSGPGVIYWPQAMDISRRNGAGITVAVLDSGVDLDHPDLRQQLVRGWDFVNDDSRPDDDDGHGTHVAGTIAARTNNRIGVAGVAPNARIMPVKVCSPGGCNIFDIALGIVHATDNRARVINMSLGGSGISSTVQAAVGYAISRDVVVVASAGNSGGTGYSYPASYPGVISVGAHDISGTIAGFSTHNDRVTVSAPGVDILSTVPIEMGSYAYADGTSMAAPHVAGIAALILSDRIASTPAGVREALMCGALDRGAAGYDNYYGWGHVQADRALNWDENSASCKITQPNDDFTDATLIRRVPYTQQGIAIHERSVTRSIPTDPGRICGATYTQSLWWSFTAPASDWYQINTTGASYNTILGIFQGQQGALNEIACNDDLDGLQSSVPVQLQARQQYYILVGTYGSTPVNDEVLSLSVRRGMDRTGVFYEENAPYISYTGTWQGVNDPTASRRRIMQTTDDSATASFTFRGTGFSYFRTVGPAMGDTQIYVDGAYYGALPNRAAHTASAEYVLDVGGNAGDIHQVVLRRSDSGPDGPIALDRIRTYDSSFMPEAVLRGLQDDRRGTTDCNNRAMLCLSNGTFTQLTVSGSYRNTVTETTDPGARVNFRATGSTIVIYRNTAPGFASMGVYVNGELYETVSNSDGTAQNVPYVISGLAPATHQVQIINQGTLQLDAVQAYTPPVLRASSRIINENSAALVYGGQWEQFRDNTYIGRTSRSTDDPNATVDFDFNGNWFCVYYVRRPDGGDIDVYVDGESYGIFSTAGSPGSGYSWCSGLLNTSQHHVRLDPNSGPVDLDGIQAQQQIVITPQMGMVQESHRAFMYDTAYGSWRGFSGRSPGGYRFQGNRANRTTINGARLGFWINGTGFILYTSGAPDTGVWRVYVNGSLWPMTIGGSQYTGVRLNTPRFQPFALGYVNLPPGLNYVELRTDSIQTGGYMDFDGIRVFP